MKYWLMAVSSAERTSCRTFRISGSPFIRCLLETLSAGILPRRVGHDVSFAHERERPAGTAGHRGWTRAMGWGGRQGAGEKPGLEEGLDDRLRGACRAAGRTRHAAGPGLRARPRLAGGVPLHARRPPDGLPRQALDDAPVRRLWHGEADQRALPLSPRPRADRPLDGLPPADAIRL